MTPEKKQADIEYKKNYYLNNKPKYKERSIKGGEQVKMAMALLKQLEQDNPTTTLVEQAIVAEKAIKQIENDQTLKARVLGALKSAGKEYRRGWRRCSMFITWAEHSLLHCKNSGIESRSHHF
jgi:hypothetical protein